MSLSIKCETCNKELTEPSALVFSPPTNEFGIDICVKIHICKICWPGILALITSRRQINECIQAIDKHSKFSAEQLKTYIANMPPQDREEFSKKINFKDDQN